MLFGTFAPLAACAIVGLALGVFQAATQIQEQTIVYVSKLGVLSLLCFFTGPWCFDQMVEFMRDSLSIIAYLGALK